MIYGVVIIYRIFLTPSAFGFLMGSNNHRNHASPSAAFQFTIHKTVLDEPIIPKLLHLRVSRLTTLAGRLVTQVLLDLATHQRLDTVAHHTSALLLEDTQLH
jgi:hypothetical protein